MKKNLFFFVFTLTTISVSSQEIADTAFEKTIFWRITGNGLRDTSYLYGTAHPIFREDLKLSDTVLHVFLKAKAVYFENTPTVNDDSLFRVLNIMDKANLRQLLGKICYSKLMKTLQERNDPVIDDPLFDKLKPQYFSNRIVTNIFGKRLTSVDAILIAIALGNNQEIFALDRPEMRKKMADRISLDQQAKNLYSLVNDSVKTIKEFTEFTKAMTAIYNSGDFSFLYTRVNYIRMNDVTTGSNYTFRIRGIEEFLDERNKEWIPKIEAACQKQSTFFAFGAAHLAGKKGIITLLRKKGYTITPIFLQLGIRN